MREETPGALALAVLAVADAGTPVAPCSCPGRPSPRLAKPLVGRNSGPIPRVTPRAAERARASAPEAPLLSGRMGGQSHTP
eukprot:14081722-Heterocapsa_arctica.AAC.1